MRMSAWIEDIGLLSVSQDAAEGLYRLVDAAYEKRSVAISSNLHPAAFDFMTATGQFLLAIDTLWSLQVVDLLDCRVQLIARSHNDNYEPGRRDETKDADDEPGDG